MSRLGAVLNVRYLFLCLAAVAALAALPQRAAAQEMCVPSGSCTAMADDGWVEVMATISVTGDSVLGFATADVLWDVDGPCGFSEGCGAGIWGVLYDNGNPVDEDFEDYGDLDVAANVEYSLTVGHAYEFDATGGVCSYAGGEGWDDDPTCQPDYTVSVYFQTGVPHIDGIAPSAVTVGSSSGSANPPIAVSGEYFYDDFGMPPTIATTLNGSSMSDIGFAPSQDQYGNLILGYSVPTSAATGTRSLTVSTRFGTSNAVNLTVGDPSPVINSISPNNWTAGSGPFTVQITGTGFGTNPFVSVVSGAGVSISVNPGTATDNGTSASFTATVTVAPNAPTETVTLQVQSQGYAGNSYAPANPGQSQTAVGPPVNVAANLQPPTINLLNGTTYSPLAGQAISLSVSPPSGLPLASQLWTFANPAGVFANYPADAVANYILVYNGTTPTCGAPAFISPTAQTVCNTAVPAFSTAQATLPTYYYIVPNVSETVTVTVTYNLAGGTISSQVPATQTFTVQVARRGKPAG